MNTFRRPFTAVKSFFKRIFKAVKEELPREEHKTVPNSGFNMSSRNAKSNNRANNSGFGKPKRMRALHLSAKQIKPIRTG